MKHLITQDMKQELIKFTQEIISIPSYTGAEEKAAKFILRKLREFGVENSFIDGIGNVVGILRGKGLGPNIMLNSHMDVVPEGSINNWRGFDPFGGESINPALEAVKILPDYIYLKISGGIRANDQVIDYFQYIDRIGTSTVLN